MWSMHTQRHACATPGRVLSPFQVHRGPLTPMQDSVLCPHNHLCSPAPFCIMAKLAVQPKIGLLRSVISFPRSSHLSTQLCVSLYLPLSVARKSKALATLAYLFYPDSSQNLSHYPSITIHSFIHPFIQYLTLSHSSWLGLGL